MTPTLVIPRNFVNQPNLDVCIMFGGAPPVDLLDLKKKDQHAKLLKVLRLLVMGPVGQYFPPQGPCWEEIKKEANGM